MREIFEHGGALTQAEFRHDGKAILTSSIDGTAQVWDAVTGLPVSPRLEHGDQVLSATFSPDGRLILTGGSDGKARLWDALTGKAAAPISIHNARILTLAFSPDGQSFVTLGDDSIARIWKTATGRLVGNLVGNRDITTFAFSPEGRSILTGGRDGRARLWDIETARPTAVIFQDNQPIEMAKFSPDGRLVATTSEQGTVGLWETNTGRPIGPIPRQRKNPQEKKGQSRILFSPDGRLLLSTGQDGSARLWDTSTGQPIGATMPHGEEITDVAFSPDGKLVASASSDHKARLWDSLTGRPVGSPLRHRLFVKPVRFSPDGRLLLTASQDGTAKLWELGGGEIVSNALKDDNRSADESDPTPSHRPGVLSRLAAFSPDRSRILLGSSDNGLARLVDTETGQPVGPPMIHRWPTIEAVAFSPDSRLVATTSHDRGIAEGGSTSSTCQIWDADTARPASPLLPHINYVGAMAFRPDGKVLATGDYSRAIHLWDVKTGRKLGQPMFAESIVLSLAFSPDGRMLAAGTAEPSHQVVLWDLANQTRVGEPVRFRGAVSKLAFSPDGTRLAAASSDSTARLIHVNTGQVIGETLRHEGAVVGLAFSPDGQKLLTASRGASKGAGGAACLWNSASGQSSRSLALPDAASGAIAFSPDGTRFAAGCEDGSVQLWDMGSGLPLGPPRILRDRVLGVAFTADGQTLLSVDAQGSTDRFSVPSPVHEPIDRLVRRVQLRTGLELDSSREIPILAPGTSGLGLDSSRKFAILAPETWRRLREEVNGDSRETRPADDLIWHEASARDAEAIGNPFAARWHLSWLTAARPADGLLRARHAMAILLQGDPDRAGTELSHAIEDGPRDRILDWLLQRSEDLRVAGRLEDALRLLDRVTASRPADGLNHALRAELFANLGRPTEREREIARAIDLGADTTFLMRLADERSRAGDWKAAADLYDRAIARGPVPYEVWIQAGTAHLESDDPAGYRRVCEILRSRHDTTLTERWVQAELAIACSLGPGGIGDDGKPQAWSESMLAKYPERKSSRHIANRVRALIHYRSGQFRETIERINEGIKTDDGAIDDEDVNWLALAYLGLGDYTKAREILASHRLDSNQLRFWYSIGLRLIRRQAEQILFDHDFPVDPFTP